MRCERCDLEIRGNKEKCPLCQGKLAGSATQSPFPVLPKKKWRSLSIGGIAAFIMLVFGCVMVLMGLIAGQILSWQPLVILSAVIGYIDLHVIMYYRTNVLKTITAQIIAGMVVCVYVDFWTGWHAWSVAYVLPALFPALIAVTLIAARLLQMKLQDFVLYLLFDLVASLGQLFFLFTKWNPKPVLTELSFAVEFIFFAGILCFRWKDFRSASNRYFNI